MAIEKRSVTRFELLMDAGAGAQKMGDILLGAFVAMGKYVYVEPIIPAEISPPPRNRASLSGVIMRLADFDITNIGNNTDLILAAHEVVLDRRLDDKEYYNKGSVVLDMGFEAGNPEAYEKTLKRCTDVGLTVYPFHMDKDSVAILTEMGKGQNFYYLGMLSYMYDMNEESVQVEIIKAFGKKLKEDILAKNITIYHNGYQLAKQLDLPRVHIDSHATEGQKILIDGNTSMTMGIIDAGIKMFSGYPITPASSIMHILAKEFPSYGGIVHQAEDEIAAIGAAIGAYYGGVPAVTATSGPGLSLKQEFIGFATTAEVPLIVIDVQRSGPSTGMPTRTEQSDLLAALFGSHGDFAKVVIGVSNVIDCFYAPHMARYLTEKLRVPVFIMSDFQTANSYKVVAKLPLVQMNNVDELPDFVFERFHMKRLTGTVEMVNPLQAAPGTPGGMRRITGLNINSQGKVSYFSEQSQRAHEVRAEKIHYLQRSLKAPEMFGKDTNDILIVGWGSTRGVIEETIGLCEKQGVAASGMHFRIVYPMPLDLKSIFARYKKVVTVEVAYGDDLKPSPLAMLLRSETLVDVKPMMASATGRPLRPRLVVDKIKEVLK